MKTLNANQRRALKAMTILVNDINFISRCILSGNCGRYTQYMTELNKRFIVKLADIRHDNNIKAKHAAQIYMYIS